MKHEDWKGVRVLVTGARGFIASRLCRRLLRAGATVHGVSRLPPAEAPGLLWSCVDLTDLGAVRELRERVNPDIVFHLAGHVSGQQLLEHVQPTLWTNLVSTVHLLTVAAETRTGRIVLTGSMLEPPFDDPAAVPSSPYAVSKWACTAYARAFHSMYQLPVVVARPMMVYGPGQWDTSKLLPYVILSMLKSESIRVSSGSGEFDWVYVDDVVDGLMGVAMAPDVDGKTLDLGTGRLTGIRQIIEQAMKIADTNVPVHFGALPDRPYEPPRPARVEATRRLTGWEAATSIPEGLARTIEWYRSAPGGGSGLAPQGTARGQNG